MAQGNAEIWLDWEIQGASALVMGWGQRGHGQDGGHTGCDSPALGTWKEGLPGLLEPELGQLLVGITAPGMSSALGQGGALTVGQSHLVFPSPQPGNFPFPCTLRGDHRLDLPLGIEGGQPPKRSLKSCFCFILMVKKWFVKPWGKCSTEGICRRRLQSSSHSSGLSFFLFSNI